MNFITNFHKSRSTLIGSSDIAALIQHPEKTESLAGYERTALTVWEEKTGRTKREPAGFAAEMGHVLEPYVLREFIRNNQKVNSVGDALQSNDIAQSFYRGYILCELDKSDDGYKTAPDTQTTDYLHHTEAITDYGVAHADCINLNKKIIIEAKSGSYWPVDRKDDKYKGYDFTLKEWHGIPLANYYQIQYQAAIYQEAYNVQIDTAYLALIYDTNKYQDWEIRINRRVQERLIELAHYMKTCIEKDIPPKMLAMNAKDIQIMYPKINEDFRHVSGDELTAALSASRQAAEAAKQIKAWKQTEEDAKNMLAVLLKDNKKLQGMVDGDIVDIAAWQERGESERILGLEEIKKDKRLYNYVLKNELIKKIEASRFIKIKYKGE